MRPLVTRPTYSVPSAAWAMPLGYRAPLAGRCSSRRRTARARPAHGRKPARRSPIPWIPAATRKPVVSSCFLRRCAPYQRGVRARTVSGASSVAHSSSARSSVSAARASRGDAAWTGRRSARRHRSGQAARPGRVAPVEARGQRRVSPTRRGSTRLPPAAVPARGLFVRPGPQRAGASRSGQQPTRQRRPGRQRDPLFPAQRHEVLLVLANDQVVLALHRDELRQAVVALEGEHLHEAPGRHRRGAEVTDLAGTHQAVEGFAGFLDRGFRIEAMDHEEIQVVRTQPPQRGIHAGKQMLARQAAGVGPVAHGKERLGGDYQVLAREVPERASEDPLTRRWNRYRHCRRSRSRLPAPRE